MTRVFYGWYVAIASFIFGISFGFFNSYGVFFLPIQRGFAVSETTTSLVYSLALGSYTVGGVLAGSIADRSGPRITGFLGAALLAGGLALSSTATSLLELYLYYGVIAGLGWAFVIMSGTPSVIRWFTKKRGTALSFSTTGSATGVLLLPVFLQTLVSFFGWRDAFLASGCVALALMVPASLVVRKNPEQMGLKPFGYDGTADGQAKPEESIRARKALKMPAFWILYVSFLFGGLSVTAYLVHIVPYSVENGTATALAAAAVSFVGLGSLVGRLGGGRISDNFGRMNSLSTYYFLTSSGVMVLLLNHGLYTLYFASLLVGIGYGGFITANAAAAGDIFGGGSISFIWGLLSTAFGIGGVLGPLAVGYLHDSLGNYIPSFWMIAIFELAASALVATHRRLA